MNVYDRPVVKLFLKHGFQVVGVKEGDIVSEQAAQQKEKPNYQVGERSIKEIIKDLSKVIPASVLKSKEIKGTKIVYLPWFQAVRYLDALAPGWRYEVRSVQQTTESVVVVVRITIPCAEGEVYREATGIEDAEGVKFGDSSSNSESMALRRAAAKFGLGLYLYDK